MEAPMATAEQVLAAARAELGVKESPAGSNNVKYNTAYYGQEVWDGKAGGKYPWCMVFLWWCFRRAGAAELFFDGKKTASCGSLMSYARSRGQWVTSGYLPGDIVIYDFPGGGAADHCGIVVTPPATGVRAIEGNTALGNDSNGGEVMERIRPTKYIVGAYRPRYETEEDNVVRYQYLRDVPTKFRPTIEKLMDAGIIQGDGSDPIGNGDVIDLSHDQVRTLVFIYRGGGFDARLREAGLTPAVG